VGSQSLSGDEEAVTAVLLHSMLVEKTIRPTYTPPASD
jgi:hypothetical protein